MSASNLSLAQHLANGQLPMFMTGNEMKTHLEPKYGDRHARTMSETDGQFWGRKLREASTRKTSGGTLRKDIAANGMESPVEASFPSRRDPKPEILDGHHRVAVAAKDHPDTMMPVTFRNRNWWE